MHRKKVIAAVMCVLIAASAVFFIIDAVNAVKEAEKTDPGADDLLVRLAIPFIACALLLFEIELWAALLHFTDKEAKRHRPLGVAHSVTLASGVITFASSRVRGGLPSPYHNYAEAVTLAFAGLFALGLIVCCVLKARYKCRRKEQR